jgi:hypothetical protein
MGFPVKENRDRRKFDNIPVFYYRKCEPPQLSSTFRDQMPIRPPNNGPG